MTNQVVQTEWLDKQAARISALAEQADEATRKGLEHYRDIGQVLRDVKETFLGKKGNQGAFGKWCDENTPFVDTWRSRLMRLSERWPEIEAKMDRISAVDCGFSVDRAVALLRPPSATPIKAGEANKLRGLVNHAMDTSAGQEADTAKGLLRKYASERGVPVDAFVAAIVTRTDALEAKKSQMEQDLDSMRRENRRLRDILDKHNIPY